MALSGELAGARRGERGAYGAALAEREAAAASAEADRSGRGAAGSRTLCLRGAETPAARVARFLEARTVDAAGRLDVAALARVSRRAAELERGAALPQRMGRRRAASGDAWEPIEAPDRICLELAGGDHGSRRAPGAK
jgi:hypothetical protein